MLLKKQVSLYLVLILIAFFTIGCQSKTDKIINEKYSQAETYVENGDLESAINIYNEILTIQDSELVKQKLENAIAEKKAVDLTKQLLDEFRIIRENIGNTSSPEDIMTLLKPIGEIIYSFERIDTSTDTEISNFIITLKKNAIYELFKSDYVSGKNITNQMSMMAKREYVFLIVGDLILIRMPKKYTNY